MSLLILALIIKVAVAYKWNPFDGILQAPLLLRGASFVYPTTITNSFQVACPGGKLVLKGVHTTFEVAQVTYDSDGQLIINKASHRWNEVYCSNNPEVTARLTKNRCNSNEVEAEIGFAITSNRFARTMLICFDKATQSSKYSHYDLVPIIHHLQKKNPDYANWIQGSGIFTLEDINRLYSKETQRATINKLIGLHMHDKTYIDKVFFTKGQLTAKSGFFYAAQQNSTYHFLNALPQWRTYKDGNWKQAEIDVRDYADINEVHLKVWTGGYGVITLRHDKTKVKTKLYLYVNRNQKLLPIPEFFWKVIYNPKSKRGVALITSNNPYSTTIDKFCVDQSDSLTWLRWVDKNDYRKKGILWACKVPDFKRKVDILPDFEVTGLLE